MNFRVFFSNSVDKNVLDILEIALKMQIAISRMNMLMILIIQINEQEICLSIFFFHDSFINGC